jgi:hypothetical protein
LRAISCRMTAVSPTTSISTLDRSSASGAAAVDFFFPLSVAIDRDVPRQERASSGLYWQ